MTLPERIEQAEGPSRKLFIEAYYACFGVPETEAQHRPFDRFRVLIDAEAWTDAALTLVPEGWVTVLTIYMDNVAEVRLFDDRVATARLPDVETTATPALAICAAALRARGL